MADEMTKSFESLPIDQLICAPILAVAQGQSELCRVYLDYVFELAYEKGADGKPGSRARVIEFNLNRNIITPDGDVQAQPIKVEAPLLALVPVPAFTMDETTLRFTMEGGQHREGAKRQIVGDRRGILEVGIYGERLGQGDDFLAEYARIGPFGEVRYLRPRRTATARGGHGKADADLRLRDRAHLGDADKELSVN